jgi:hypothetical protein
LFAHFLHFTFPIFGAPYVLHPNPKRDFGPPPTSGGVVLGRSLVVIRVAPSLSLSLSLYISTVRQHKIMEYKVLLRGSLFWLLTIFVCGVESSAVDHQQPQLSSPPPPQPKLLLRRRGGGRDLQQTNSITLELLRASTGDSIATIGNDATIAVSSDVVPMTDLTIVATVRNGDDVVTFVKFALTRITTNNNGNNGNNNSQQQQQVYKKYEGRAPYTLCGKKGSPSSGVNYTACDESLLVVGPKYRLSVELSTGVTMVTTFRLVNDNMAVSGTTTTTTTTPSLTTSASLTFAYDLIDTSSSPQRIIYANMPSNAKIYKSDYKNKNNNRMDDDIQLTVSVRPSSTTSSSGTVVIGALQFDNGRVEQQAPYSYCGDTAGVYNDCFAFSVVATAAGGSTIAQQQSRTISFQVLSPQGKVVGAEQSFSFSLADDDDGDDDGDADVDEPEDVETEPEEEETEEEPTVVVEEEEEEEEEEENTSGSSIVPAGQWQLTSNLPITARHEACFVWVDDKGYLLGGRRSPPTDIYDRRTNGWSQGKAPPIDLHHLQCVVVNTTEIWIVVAWTGFYPREDSVAYIYIYDTVTDTWSTKPGLPVNRRRGSAAVVVAPGLNRIYVSHGSNGGHATTQNTNVVVTGYLDYYDMDRDEWVTNLPNAPNPRDHTGGAFLHDRYLCVAGGRDGSVVGWPAVLPTDCFDTVTMRWTTPSTPATNDLPALRSGSSYGTSCNGDYLLLAGGEMGDRVYGDVYAYDGTTWTTLASTLRTARHGSSLAMDCQCDRIWLASGSGGPRGGPELTSMEVLGGSGSSGC